MISYDQSKKILKKAKIKIKDEIILSENSLNRVISNNDPFFNINTKEDLKKAEEILKHD